MAALLSVWDKQLNISASGNLFPYTAPSAPGLYSCFTFGVDLAHTCNPLTSYYVLTSTGFGKDNFYCLCYDSSKPCPTKDLSQAPDLFINLYVRGEL